MGQRLQQPQPQQPMKPQAALIHCHRPVDNHDNQDSTAATMNQIFDEGGLESPLIIDEGELESPLIIVNDNHRSTLFLSSASFSDGNGNDDKAETMTVVIFCVPCREYEFYADSLQSNYLTCLFHDMTMDFLRQRHLQSIQSDADTVQRSK